MGRALQAQISLINVVNNFISVRSRIRQQVRLTRKYFHPGYLYAAIVSLLEKPHGVQKHVRMLKRKLKNRPPKVTPVRRCFLSTFTLITFTHIIYTRKASKIQMRKLCKIKATVEIHLYHHIFEHETQKYATSDLFTSAFIERKKLKRFVAAVLYCPPLFLSLSLF